MIPHIKQIARFFRFDSSPVAPITATFPSRIHPGTILLGQYRVGQRVGRGGQGRVYSGEDVHINRVVAIKEARPKDINSLKCEFLMLKRAAPSGVAPKPYDVIDDYSSSFLIMQWIGGVTLQKYLQELQWVSLNTALAIMVQCLESLEKLHRTQVIHGDLKPGNILLAPGGVIFVDLGISLQSGTFQTVEARGTPGYVAPEQLEGRPCMASDMYSLGLTFLYLCQKIDVCFGEAAVIELLQEILAPMMYLYPGRRPAPAMIKDELQRLQPSIRRR